MRNYFTDWDKQVLGSFKELIGSVWTGLIQLVSLNRYQWSFVLILTLGLGMRLCGWNSGQVLEEEVRVVRETLGLISFSDHFKYESSSFYGLLLTIPTLAVLVIGSAKLWFSASMIFKTYGVSLITYPYVLFSSRLFCLILFVVTLFLLWQLGRRFFNERVGLVSALLLAFVPVAIETSRFALPQNFVLLLVVLLAWAYLAQRNILFGVVWGLLSATTYHGIFLGPFVFFIFFFVNQRCAWTFLWSSLTAYLLATFYLHFDLPVRLDAIAFSIQQRTDLFHILSLKEETLFLGKQLSWGLLVGVIFCCFLSFKRQLKNRLVKAAFVLIELFLISFYYHYANRPEDLLWVVIPFVLLLALFIDWLWQKRLQWGVLFLIGYGALLLPDLSALLKDSPTFQARLKPQEIAFSSFTPGDWKADYLLGKPYQPMDWVQTKVAQAYTPKFKPVSIANKEIKCRFLNRFAYVDEIQFAVKSDSGREKELALVLDSGKKVVGLLKPKKGWQDVSFKVRQAFPVGEEVAFRFETNESIELLFSSDEIYLDQEIVYKRGPGLPKPELHEVLFNVIYSKERNNETR